jgi:uncharacterized membrane protein
MTSALHDLTDRIGARAALDRVAEPLADRVHRALPQGRLKDLLRGRFLGHALHPLLTDIPIGSFTSASVLDLIGGRRAEGGADALVALGLVSAVPTVAAGLADWSDTDGGAKRIGVVHATANAIGLALYGASLVARRRNRRASGTLLALAGMSVMTVGGYLGGHLVFGRGVGVGVRS